MTQPSLFAADTTEPAPPMVCLYEKPCQHWQRRVTVTPWDGDDEERHRTLTCVRCPRGLRESENLRMGK